MKGDIAVVLVAELLASDVVDLKDARCHVAGVDPLIRWWSDPESMVIDLVEKLLRQGCHSGV